ncbi:MAG: preprotein translocase subunit SecG [Pseudomonadota bacterium]
METLILVVHVIAALGVIGLVLLQHGKGADAGAAFGGGSAGGVFGSAGAANFLSRTTAVLAVVFFLTSLGLTVMSARRTEHKGVMSQPVPAKSAPSDVPVPTTSMGQTVPAAPAGDGSKAGELPK